MRARFLAIGLVGVAAALCAGSCVSPAGTPCLVHQDCDFHDYCDDRLGQCVRWEGEDPTCARGCASHQYCTKSRCSFRFQRLQIDSPTADSVVPGSFTVAYSILEHPEAAETLWKPFELTLRAYAEGAGTWTASTTVTALQGQLDASVSADASVTLQLSAGGIGTGATPPVQVFVDQTR